MAMLAVGVDLSTIASWLGHESVSTTHKHMTAEMETKARARAVGRQEPVRQRAAGQALRPKPGLLAFLDSL